MPFKTLRLAGRDYALNELTFHQAIKISRINPRHNEQRLTLFLQSVLSEETAPLQMSAQHRYALLIAYLSAVPDCLISIDIEPNKYLKSGLDDVPSATLNGYTVRPLSGHDLHVLENVCDGLADWLVGAMALQLSYPKGQELPDVDCSEAERDSALRSRSSALKNMPLSEFDHTFAMYSHLNSELMTVCELGMDDHGLTVLGGTDDAPVRFRPSTAFTGLCAELDKRTHGARSSSGQ